MEIQNIPGYVPTSIKDKIQENNFFLANSDAHSQRKINSIKYQNEKFEILCKHPNMKIVWRRIQKRRSISRLTVFPKMDNALHFTVTIIDSLHRSQWDYLTVSERRLKREKIVQRLNKLAGELKKFGLGSNLLMLFKNDELEKIYKRKLDVSQSTIDIFQFPISLSDVMTRCASQLEFEEKHSSILISQPNRENADFTLFARKLAQFVKLHLKLTQRF